MSPALKSRAVILASLVLAWIVGSGVLPSQPTELSWYKGKLHTHTINSDGDSSPDTVARWYKEHRYHFLALTDHNYLTEPQGLSSLLGASERFLLITGEEVTTSFRDAPVHVNAFRLSETIQPASGQSVQGTVQANVDRILAAGSIPSLNHPFFRWAIDADVFRAVERLKLFEVFNGIPDTNDEWGLEEMWDGALRAYPRGHSGSGRTRRFLCVYRDQASGTGPQPACDRSAHRAYRRREILDALHRP